MARTRSGRCRRLGPFRTGRGLRPPPLNDNYLIVDGRQLDFGTVWMDHQFPWTISLRNPTDQVIEVSRIGVSCGCVSAEPARLTVPAHGKADVKLVMDLTDKSERDFQSENKEFEVKVTAQSADGRGATWAIRGHVKKALRGPQPAVDFADKLVRGQPNPPRSVRFTSLHPLRLVNASCDEASFRVQVRPAEPHDGKGFELEVSPSDSIRAGPFRYAVRLELVPKESGPPMSAIIPVRGTVLEDVQPLPLQIAAGAVHVGETAEDTIELRSVSGQPFEVKSVTSDQGVSVKPVDETPLSTKRLYRVTYRANAAGHQRSEITFKLFNTKFGEMGVKVTVSYHGIEAPRGRQ